MNRAVLSIIAAVLLLLGYAAQAEVVSDLHSAEVPVADRTQAALNAAARDGLAQVLVKVSGSIDVLNYPAIKAVLPKSRSYVQQYAYAVGEGNALLARFEFNDTVIAGLLTEARTRDVAVAARGLSTHYRHLFDITRLSDLVEVEPAT